MYSGLALPDPSLIRFRKIVEVACEALEARREEINDLNVFPVADGDTGDNMARTMRAVLEALDQMATDGRAIDEIGRDEIVHAVSRAALLGARGNSGVILSQIVRGLAEEMASRPGQRIDPPLMASALGRAADAAYQSVRDPREGTMLTVIREIAHRVSFLVAHAETSFNEPVSDEQQERVLAELARGAVDVGEESVARGPELLPLLKESGVVDSGGYGLVVIMSGFLASLSGDRDAPERVRRYTAPRARGGEPHSSSRYRHCTNFAVTGSELDAKRFEADLERLGDSVLVIGDDTTLRVHIHTDDPDAAMSLFAEFGELVDVELEDMHAMVSARDARLAAEDVVAPVPRPLGRCGVVAVAGGLGIARHFGDLGATVIDGGMTLNPSTRELLAAIEAAPEEEVVVLPNSPNVLLAAERAAELADKTVALVPTASQQAGLSVMIAHDPGASAERNARLMNESLAYVKAGGVAPAVRDDSEGRFRKGDAVGFVDEDLIAWGEPESTLRSVLTCLGVEAEVMTCIEGRGAPLSGDQVRELAPPDAELELLDGGQPNWWWLIAAE